MRIFPIFHDQPLRRKLLFIILASIAMSLILVLFGFWTYEFTTYRNRLTQEITEQAGFIIASSAPTLAFDDAETAHEVLATLKAFPAIAVAALYRTDGKMFAYFGRADQPSISPPNHSGPEGLHFIDGRLELVRFIEQKGYRLGTLYLRADAAKVQERLKRYANILLVVLLAIVGGAVLLQRLLQRLISDPILAN